MDLLTFTVGLVCGIAVAFLIANIVGIKSSVSTLEARMSQQLDQFSARIADMEDFLTGGPCDDPSAPEEGEVE